MPTRPVIIAALVLLPAATWFALASRPAGRSPGGASPSGLAFGIAGGAIILFEAAYRLRRRLVNWQFGRRPAWRSAHLWLGSLSLPLVAMHAGFRSGGQFTTSLVVIYGLVVASGVGLWFAQRRGAVRGDVDPDRIDALRSDLATQVRELIDQSCGAGVAGEQEATPNRRAAADPVALTTERTAGRLRGRVVELHHQRTPLSGGEELRSFWSNQVAPFLDRDPPSTVPLTTTDAARREFDALRARLGPRFFSVIDHIEETCNRRRGLLSAERQRAGLEVWLLIHSPLAAALVVLTIAHVVTAWRFR